MRSGIFLVWCHMCVGCVVSLIVSVFHKVFRVSSRHKNQHSNSNSTGIEASSLININLLLTEREGRIGEYWPEVVTVRTEHREVRTKTTEDQYSPVRREQARLVSSLLYDTRHIILYGRTSGAWWREQLRKNKLPQLTPHERFTSVSLIRLSFLDWEPSCGDNIHHTFLSSATGLESPKSLASDRASFWDSFSSIGLVAFASPSLHASMVVFFSIFKLTVFSMLNENFFATCKVKRWRKLEIVAVSFSSLWSLLNLNACTQMYLRAKGVQTRM